MTQPDGKGADQKRLAELEAEADHARRRYELYKQKVYGPRKASPVRLRELQRERESAERRFSRAQGALRAAEKGDTEEQEAVEDARIEAEVKRDPHRADTKIARAARVPVTAVRKVRERLGLYPTERT
jgi:hypothetical protein